MPEQLLLPDLPIVDAEQGIVDTTGFRAEAMSKLHAAVSANEDELIHVHGFGEAAARKVDAGYSHRLRLAWMKALSLALPGCLLAILSVAALVVPFLPLDLEAAVRGLAAVMAYPCLLAALNLLYPAHALHVGEDRRNGHNAWLAGAARQRAQSILGIGRKFLYVVGPGAFSASVAVQPVKDISRIDVEPLDGEEAQLIFVRSDGSVARFFAGMDKADAENASASFDLAAERSGAVDLVKHDVPEVTLA